MGCPQRRTLLGAIEPARGRRSPPRPPAPASSGSQSGCWPPVPAGHRRPPRPRGHPPLPGGHPLARGAPPGPAHPRSSLLPPTTRWSGPGGEEDGVGHHPGGDHGGAGRQVQAFLGSAARGSGCDAPRRSARPGRLRDTRGSCGRRLSTTTVVVTHERSCPPWSARRWSWPHRVRWRFARLHHDPTRPGPGERGQRQRHHPQPAPLGHRQADQAPAGIDEVRCRCRLDQRQTSSWSSPLSPFASLRHGSATHRVAATVASSWSESSVGARAGEEARSSGSPSERRARRGPRRRGSRWGPRGARPRGRGAGRERGLEFPDSLGGVDPSSCHRPVGRHGSVGTRSRT